MKKLVILALSGLLDFKTRTGFGKVDKKFYKEGFSNYANGLFTFPPFFFPHFTPFMTKGKKSLMIDGRISKYGLENIETMVGGQTKYGMIGFGAKNLKDEGTYPSMMYFSPLSFGNLKGFVEVYANPKESAKIYLTTEISNNQK